VLAAETESSSTMAKISLVGFDNFVRTNPLTDRFDVRTFHHIEIVCGDASTTAARWSRALGLPLVARSNLSTGNERFASHVLGSGSIRFVFTAPCCDSDVLDGSTPSVTLSPRALREYTALHGF
jgi:4-hydroxyphenylpyruvate dioxygenase